MLNLSEITIAYIRSTFIDELQTIIYNSFSLQEAFGIKYYEDKYIDLISRYDSIDRDSKQDNFILLLKKDMVKIINEHFIKINDDMDIHLNELNEIVHFLFIIQNLEDYREVDYILHSNNTPRRILITLIKRYTLLQEFRLMELLDNVEKTIIDALQAFVEDKNQTDEEELDRQRLKHINHFFNFINKTECLGLKLYEKGYSNTTLRELLDLNNFNLPDYIDKLILTNLPQASLDILSILIITKDDYTLPMLKFNQNTVLFTNKFENITKLTMTLTSMLNDFNQYLDAEKEKEKLNDN